MTQEWLTILLAGGNLQAVDFIHANEVILTFGYSRTVLQFLKRAKERRDFQACGDAFTRAWVDPLRSARLPSICSIALTPRELSHLFPLSVAMHPRQYQAPPTSPPSVGAAGGGG